MKAPIDNNELTSVAGTASAVLLAVSLPLLAILAISKGLVLVTLGIVTVGLIVGYDLMQFTKSSPVLVEMDDENERSVQDREAMRRQRRDLEQ